MTRVLLSESEGYALLRGQRVPVPEHVVVHKVQAAVDAAKRYGFPVVMKIVSPQVVHKSNVGGVVMGVSDEEGVRQAYQSIVDSVRQKVPGAQIKGIIVEKMMPKGLELIIGGKTDPSFGKIITFGLGGTLVEIIKDVSIRVLPIGKRQIEAMVREIKGYALIQGYRDEPPRDEKSLVNIIESICQMFEKKREIVEFDINPLILYEKGACAVDARFYRDDQQKAPTAAKHEKRFSPDIFYPRSIAVVGATGDSTKVGYAVVRNLMDFPGKVYPVNPAHKEVLGSKSYPSVTAIEGRVDMAVIAVPAAAVPQVMEACGRKRVRLAVLITAGFREIGKEGEALEDKVLAIAAKHGIRVVGPNCLGILLPHKKINATFDPVSPRAGSLAFISQSGAIITTVVDWSLQENRGFSAVISVGNQGDMGFDEFLRFAGEDEDTKCIVLYVEQIKNGAAFMKAVREVIGKKPIVAIKSGASQKGQKAASSHTGSLAGSYEVYMAAFRQCGVIPASSLKEAFQIGELLASEGFPAGPRALIVSNAGGFAVLSTDYAERYGISLPDIPAEMLKELNTFLTEEWSHENPMDLVGDASATRYVKVFDLMIGRQQHWDIVFVIAVPTTTLDPRELSKDIVRFSRAADKMVVCCLLGGDTMKGGVHVLREANIPNFQELEESFRTVGHALRSVKARST